MDKDVLDRAGLPMDCGEGLEALSREWSKQWARGIVSSQAEEECLRLGGKKERKSPGGGGGALCLQGVVCNQKENQ